MTDRLDMDGLSMLELFRLEIQTQTARLTEGLLELEQLNTHSPVDPQVTALLETLAQSAQTLKGVACLVDVEPAAQLADRLKQCLNHLKEQAIVPPPTQIDAIYESIDLFLRLTQVEEAELPSWLTAQQEAFSRLQVSLERALHLPESPASRLPHEKAQQLEQFPEIRPVATKESDSISPTFTESLMDPTPTLSLEILSEVLSPAETDRFPEPSSPSLPSSSDLQTASLLDLFRLEVDMQASALSDGLLLLETQPQSPSILESLMRAAHSIKGAARIVALDPAVQLAHVMEDCFVAAQNQTVSLNPDQIDILLKGVDCLLSISQIPEAQLPAWLTENTPVIQAICQSIEAIAQLIPYPPATLVDPEKDRVPTETGLTQTTEVVPAAPASPTDARFGRPAPGGTIAQPASAPAIPDRVVRVSAENLNRIMGLAGESLIAANWLQPYADSLMVLKKRQQELSRLLEQLQYPTQRGQEQCLKAARQKEQECREILAERLSELELFARRTTNLNDRLYREVIASHLRPFADGVQGFPRMVRDLARSLNKQVKLEIVGKATPVDRDILKKLEAPLTHILQNCVDHGIEPPQERVAAGKLPEGTLRLEAVHRGGMLSITVTDDGRGIDPEHLRQKIVQRGLTPAEMAARLSEAELMEFLFLPGFSTTTQVTQISGRGVGLDVARGMAQEVGGTLRAVSQPGRGMSFHFQLPLTLSVVRTLLVEIAGEPYAFPLARIEQLVMVSRENIRSVENRQYFTMNQQNVGLISAYQVLEIPEIPAPSSDLAVVVISDASHHYGLVVDRFIGEHDLVVRPLDPRLGKVQDISAAALMDDGSPILILDVADLVHSIDNLLNGTRLQNFRRDRPEHLEPEQPQTKHILVVDDSITVREMERKLLQNHGYQVDVAVDGMEAWHAVCTNNYDLIISDIDMPRMSGIELVTKVKQQSHLSHIPVIIISYKNREEDRIQGLSAGADYYLTKSSFHDDTLIHAVVDLIGA